MSGATAAASAPPPERAPERAVGPVLPAPAPTPAPHPCSCHDGATNWVQRNLVPIDSTSVRGAMQKAAKLASTGNCYDAHFLAVLEVIKAVAISLFNIIAYMVRAICRFVLNVVELRFSQAFIDMGNDFLASLQSMVLVAIGVGYVVGTLIAPREVTSFFAPQDPPPPPPTQLPLAAPASDNPPPGAPPGSGGVSGAPASSSSGPSRRDDPARAPTRDGSAPAPAKPLAPAPGPTPAKRSAGADPVMSPGAFAGPAKPLALAQLPTPAGADPVMLPGAFAGLAKPLALAQSPTPAEADPVMLPGAFAGPAKPASPGVAAAFSESRPAPRSQSVPPYVGSTLFSDLSTADLPPAAPLAAAGAKSPPRAASPVVLAAGSSPTNSQVAVVSSGSESDSPPNGPTRSLPPSPPVLIADNGLGANGDGLDSFLLDPFAKPVPALPAAVTLTLPLGTPSSGLLPGNGAMPLLPPGEEPAPTAAPFNELLLPPGEEPAPAPAPFNELLLPPSVMAAVQARQGGVAGAGFFSPVPRRLAGLSMEEFAARLNGGMVPAGGLSDSIASLVSPAHRAEPVPSRPLHASVNSLSGSGYLAPGVAVVDGSLALNKPIGVAVSAAAASVGSLDSAPLIVDADEELGPLGRLKSYARDVCGIKDADFDQKVLHFVNEGRMFAIRAQTEERYLDSIPLDTEANIAKAYTMMLSLVWYLLYLSIEAKKEVVGDQFMFVFKDPGHRIDKFFAKIAYARASSHFHGRRPDKVVYGVDIIQGSPDGNLPAHKNTSHFGALAVLDVRAEWTFLKPEDFGLGSVSQWIAHAWDFLATRPAHIFGWASAIGNRKEHVPPAIKAAFNTLHQQITRVKAPAEFGTFGIARMVSYLRDHLRAAADSPHKQNIRTFVETHLKTYDCFLIRTGDELIIEDLVLLEDDGRDLNKGAALQVERQRLNAPMIELLELCQ